MRYPIFLFESEEGRDVHIFCAPEGHGDYLESHNIQGMIPYDSEGRRLTATDVGEDLVRISDSGAPPDPERLRHLLSKALRRRWREWHSDASLESLIAAAEMEYQKSHEPPYVYAEALSRLWSRLLRLLRLKGPES